MRVANLSIFFGEFKLQAHQDAALPEILRAFSYRNHKAAFAMADAAFLF
jgi:hypothetical protein